MFKKLLTSTGLVNFKKNEDGVVAIEFAFIVPVLLFLYVGVVELSLLVTADRSVSHAASVAADLATQPAALDANEVENILSATLATMNARISNASRISIGITSYNVLGSTNAVTLQGHAYLGPSFASPASAAGIDSRLLNATSGIVIARVEYVYKSFGRDFENGFLTEEKLTDFTLTETFMLKPRQSAFIPIGGGGASSMSCSFSANGTGLPNVSCS